MISNIKITFIVIMTLLFCFPCFAFEKSLRIFDTDFFTIKLPAHMRQMSRSEMSSIDDENSLTYIFVESNKVRKKRISVVITTEKAYHNDLKELSRYLRDSVRHSECRNHASELTEIRFAGRKGYYFQISNEGCAVGLERYWTTINGDQFIAVGLNKPVNGDDIIFRTVEKQIPKIKLK